MSSYLLPADEVGADDRVALKIRYVLPAVQCGPESTLLWNGANPGDFARYETDDEEVVLGSWREQSWTQGALNSLSERLDEGFCSDESGKPGRDRWGVKSFDIDVAGDVVVFSAVTRAAGEGELAPRLSEPAGDVRQTFYARAYGVVERRGVSVRVRSEAPVPPDRLAALWSKQAERVRVQGS